MLGIFRKTRDDVRQQREADKALVATEADIKEQLRALAERREKIEAKIRAGTMTSAALGDMTTQDHALHNRLTTINFAKLRLVDSCPDAELVERRRRLRENTAPLCNAIADLTRSLWKERERLKGCQANLDNAERNRTGYPRGEAIVFEHEQAQEKVNDCAAGIARLETRIAELEAQRDAEKAERYALNATMQAA